MGDIDLSGHIKELLKLRDALDEQRYAGIAAQIVSLKELMLTKAGDTGLAIKTAMEAADKATEKAAQAYEKRFENTNEWRDAMDDLQNQFMRKAELQPSLNNLETRLQQLETQGKVAVGKKEGISTAVAVALSVVGTIALVVPSLIAIAAFLKVH